MRGAKVQTYREPREFDWEISILVRARFDQLVERLLQLQEDDPEAMTLREEIKRLPGFPREMRPWDLVNFVLTSKSVSTLRSN